MNEIFHIKAVKYKEIVGRTKKALWKSKTALKYALKWKTQNICANSCSLVVERKFIEIEDIFNQVCYFLINSGSVSV